MIAIKLASAEKTDQILMPGNESTVVLSELVDFWFSFFLFSFLCSLMM